MKNQFISKNAFVGFLTTALFACGKETTPQKPTPIDINDTASVYTMVVNGGIVGSASCVVNTKDGKTISLRGLMVDAGNGNSNINSKSTPFLTGNVTFAVDQNSPNRLQVATGFNTNTIQITTYKPTSGSLLVNSANLLIVSGRTRISVQTDNQTLLNINTYNALFNQVKNGNINLIASY